MTAESVLGVHESHHSAKGIVSSAGICSCGYSGTCTCFPEPSTSLNEPSIDSTENPGTNTRTHTHTHTHTHWDVSNSKPDQEDADHYEAISDFLVTDINVASADYFF